MSVLLFSLSTASAQNILNVGQGLAFETVTDAVAAASDGDTVRIFAKPSGGTYREAVTLFDVDLVIQGVGDPVLEADNLPRGFFYVHGDSEITLEGVILDGQGANRALQIDGAATLSLIDSLVRDTHHPTSNSGAVWISGDATVWISGVSFEGSIAGDGSGGMIKTTGAARLEVYDSRFSGGHSTGDGGAVHCLGSGGCAFVDTTFSGNRSDANGGALATETNTSLTVTRSRFCDNAAGANGGAMDLRSGALLESSVWMGNTAGARGGAVWFRSDDALEVSHSDLLGNAAGGLGAALHAELGAIALSHLIVAGHGGSSEVVSFDPGAPPSWSARYTLYWDNAVDASSAGPLADDVIGDPLFTRLDPDDCEGSDLTLRPDSAALDAGDPQDPDEDGSPADIGAFGPADVDDEIVGDGRDSDCDGGELCYADADEDGRGEADTVASDDLDCDDVGEAAAADDVCPGADDGLDQDQDGVPDGCEATNPPPGASEALPTRARDGSASPSGCGCRSGAPATPALLLLAVLGLRRRR